MRSTYLRYQEQVGRYIPFAPPLHSPKDTSGIITPWQRLNLWMWRVLLPVWPASVVVKRPVFLIGCHNSGTTILGRLIGKHLDMVNWSEAPEVWAPDNAFLSWGVLEEPLLPQPFLFDWDAYQRTLDQHSEHLPLIRKVFTIFAATHLRRRFINKNPHMTISIPYMQAAFPEACYVHIRRNGYAVVQSLLSNWRPVLQKDAWPALREAIDPVYFEDPLALVRLCARYWEAMDERALADLAAVPHVYYTSYEDICADPERVLREIFAQFGLNPKRFAWQQLQQPTRYPWTDMLPMENRNFKYRERLTPEEIQAVTDEVGATLAKYDYLDDDTRY